MLNIYKPYVLALLLLINACWIYALANYSGLELEVVLMIIAPLIFGVVIYFIGYIKFMKSENISES